MVGENFGHTLFFPFIFLSSFPSLPSGIDRILVWGGGAYQRADRVRPALQRKAECAVYDIMNTGQKAALMWMCTLPGFDENDKTVCVSRMHWATAGEVTCILTLVTRVQRRTNAAVALPNTVGAHNIWRWLLRCGGRLAGSSADRQRPVGVRHPGSAACLARRR